MRKINIERRTLRIVLLPIMMIVEVFLLTLNWMVAIISPTLGDRFIKWNERVLPDMDWYFKPKGD